MHHNFWNDMETNKSDFYGVQSLETKVWSIIMNLKAPPPQIKSTFEAHTSAGKVV